ncbi:MAG: aminoacyl-tRNA hydrolase [Ruminococcaceae bacterium]|nr:aminoacyl-tRNA hydrolase [Oscillospiraceae bacterium]
MSNIFDIFKRIEKENEQRANQPITHMIVGLGNPGAKYENTRHNAGFMAMDHIAARLGVTVNRAKFKALVGEATVGGKRVLLMKPQTLMNASGIAVSEAAAFYKIPVENIIVMSDDINLDVGRMRVRKSGSDGGQKGLRSIINMMGSDAFPRIRFGVGKKPHPDYDLADWVLGNFSEDDKNKLCALFAPAYDGIEKILAGDVDGAMQICNKAQI